MPYDLTIAAVQMDAQPAPTAERLGRAECLIREAALAGAQLVVLPELFNIGYSYDPRNYTLAEPITGPTRTWMDRLAAQYQIHLAGSFLVRDNRDIYNALLLVAPDGQLWRYNKCYPWGWERAYFRGGQGVIVADTTIGRIGLMVCWDTAHLELWRQYAGQVQCMVICSCPPDMTNPTYHFPNGDQMTLDDFGPFAAQIKGTGNRLFTTMINEQAAWLGVPVVNTVGSGCITTAVPRSRALVFMFAITAPRLLRLLSVAPQMQMTCLMLPGCKVVDASGTTRAEVSPSTSEAYAMAIVSLADTPPQPHGVQPPTRLPSMAYTTSDLILPGFMRRLYDDALSRDEISVNVDDSTGADE